MRAQRRCRIANAWPDAALGPGLKRGFLLSYDMVSVPRQPFTATIFGLTGTLPRAVPSDAVAAAAARALPADIVQKLLLLSIVVLACSGMAALLAGEHWLARLAGAVFYAWNPFVGERLIIGQWALLLGYGALPWVLCTLAAAAPQSVHVTRTASIQGRCSSGSGAPPGTARASRSSLDSTTVRCPSGHR